MPTPLSILIVTMLSGVISTAILLSLPTFIPGVKRWILASVLTLLSIGLVALRGQIPGVASGLIASEVFVIASLLQLQGCRQFFGRNPSVWLEYVACVAVFIAIAYWTYVSESLQARIAVASIFHVYAYLSIAWLSHHVSQLGRPKYSYRFIAVVAFLAASGHLLRGVMYGTGMEFQNRFLESTSANLLFFSLSILRLPCLAVGMAMLAHDHMAEKLKSLANTDDLTGLLTRRAFFQQAQAALAFADRSGEPLSIAIVDLDYFKAVNDRHGHASGDRVLADFAATMTKNLRASDLVGRLGGEEFAILCPATGSFETARLLDRLRAKVDGSSGTISFREDGCTFSAGVDECREGDTLESLMARADAALYEAKARGRNRVVVATSNQGKESAMEARSLAG